MRLVWTTDVHLNFLNDSVKHAFFNEIYDLKPDGVLVTGDIAEGDCIVGELKEMQAYTNTQLYFVLGNHDFYHSSVKNVREKVGLACQDVPELHYLRDQVIELTPTTALVGVDGWADAKLGNPFAGRLGMADWELIREYKDAQAKWDLNSRLAMAADYGRMEATTLRRALFAAARKYNKVIVGTHIPPFKESTWYNGKHSDDDWLPWFSCAQVGEALDDCASLFTEVQFEVYCGHTHGQGTNQVRDNLVTYTGWAHYGAPGVNKVLEL